MFAAALASTGAAQHLTPQSNYGESSNGFPSWEERAIAELSNRARVDPATELASCPAGNCPDASCYSATSPLFYDYNLNQSSRFHSTSMGMFPFFAHDTPCVLFSDIDSRFPGSSNGSFASSCSTSGTTLAQNRIALFGGSFGGENIAAGQGTVFAAFQAWLYEPTSSAACVFSSANGHRVNILTNGPALGVGYAQVSGSTYNTYWTQDFGGGGSIPKIASGSHWTASGHARDAQAGDNAVEFWANWYDAAAPTVATVVLDSVPSTMTRARGTATNGAWSATVSGVSSACHTYYFQFTDSGANIVRYPTTGALGFGAGCPDYSTGVTAPAAPTGVNAIATSTTSVQITWNAVVGATSYEIYRRDPGGAFALRNTSVTPSYTDTATAGTAYLYRVRAINAGGSSPDSAYDLATTVMFTDDGLAAGIIVKAVHLTELRTAVDAVRRQAGTMNAGTYTDPTLSGVSVKAVHITELRSNLDAAMSALSLTTGAWTDAALSGVAVRAVHFQELRNRVK